MSKSPSKKNNIENSSSSSISLTMPSVPTTASYFAPLYPWQKELWDRLTAGSDRLAHGLLFSGMQGIGKRAFVWQFVAWMLCENGHSNLDFGNYGTGDVTGSTNFTDSIDNTDLTNSTNSKNSLHNNQTQNLPRACGHCQSCMWLKVGTHPRLKVLPNSSVLHIDDSFKNTNPHQSSTKKRNSTAKTKSKADKSKADDIKPDNIKVDDIRDLTPFVSQSGSGRRICVIDHADTMTIAAANALLKTLEEPSDGVHLLLISDAPAKLLPTIKSRVQKVPIDHIQPQYARDYIRDILQNSYHTQNLHVEPQGHQTQKHTDTLGHEHSSQKDDKYSTNTAQIDEHVEQLLSLASGAPLAALAILQAPWYDKRKLWLTTWLALRTGKRSSSAASEYWQKHLSLDQFIQLTEIMLMDIKRVRLSMDAKQKDIEFGAISSIMSISFEDLHQVSQVIADIGLSVHQNVQEKLGYDKLITQLAKI